MSEHKSERLGVRLTPTERLALEKLAQEAERGLSDMARLIIRRATEAVDHKGQDVAGQGGQGDAKQ